jgi:hypothetical protein
LRCAVMSCSSLFAVMPRESGASSIRHHQLLNRSVTPYWIVRWSLASGGALRRPGGGR